MAKKGLIVGTGRAGTFLQRGAFMAAGAEIEAFVDMDLDRARRAALEYRVPLSFSTLNEALAVCRPDFVSVCTPACSHLAVASEALTAGCHVLVEKPMTTNLKEADELGALALREGRALCVVHNHKFYSGIQQAMDLVSAGEIGEIVHLDRQMMFLHDKVRMMEPGHWAHAIPGGRLFEANPHNLYLAHSFVGNMELCTMHPFRRSGLWPHVRIDGFTSTLKAARSSVQITMSLNLEASSHQRRHGSNFLVISGTRATLVVTYHNCVFLDAITSQEDPAQERDLDTSGRQALALAARKFKQRVLERRPTVDRESLSPVDLPASEVAALSLNDGANSGHKFIIERFVGFLEGRYADPPVSWKEAYETQRVNLEMGMAVERILSAEGTS